MREDRVLVDRDFLESLLLENQELRKKGVGE